MIRVLLSLLHDAMAPAAPREGISAAFILLEGDINVVLGGDVPLILPISEEIYRRLNNNYCEVAVSCGVLILRIFNFIFMLV